MVPTYWYAICAAVVNVQHNQREVDKIWCIPARRWRRCTFRSFSVSKEKKRFRCTTLYHFDNSFHILRISEQLRKKTCRGLAERLLLGLAEDLWDILFNQHVKSSWGGQIFSTKDTKRIIPSLLAKLQSCQTTQAIHWLTIEPSQKYKLHSKMTTGWTMTMHLGYFCVSCLQAYVTEFPVSGGIQRAINDIESSILKKGIEEATIVINVCIGTIWMVTLPFQPCVMISNNIMHYQTLLLHFSVNLRRIRIKLLLMTLWKVFAE